jgi:hypothetical protein
MEVRLSYSWEIHPIRNGEITLDCISHVEENLNRKEFVEDGIYDITYYFIHQVKEPGKACLKLYPYNIVEENSKESISKWTFENIQINKGDYRLEHYYQKNSRENVFPFYVVVKRVDQY